MRGGLGSGSTMDYGGGFGGFDGGFGGGRGEVLEAAALWTMEVDLEALMAALVEGEVSSAVMPPRLVGSQLGRTCPPGWSTRARPQTRRRWAPSWSAPSIG